MDDVKVRGPLNPSDVVKSSLDIDVVDDNCVHLCHSDGSTSTNVSFVVVALSPYNLTDVVIDFDDDTTSSVPAGRQTDDVRAPSSWAAECYRDVDSGQATVLWHAYVELGNFTPSAYTTVCNATCGHTSTLTVGSSQLFAKSLGAFDLRRASVRRVNETSWDVRFLVGVETAAAATAMLDFDDGTSSPVTLSNASFITDQLPYPDTWRVGEMKHTYTKPGNYSVILTISSQVDERWTVQKGIEVK